MLIALMRLLLLRRFPCMHEHLRLATVVAADAVASSVADTEAAQGAGDGARLAARGEAVWGWRAKKERLPRAEGARKVSVSVAACRSRLVQGHNVLSSCMRRRRAGGGSYGRRAKSRVRARNGQQAGKVPIGPQGGGVGAGRRVEPAEEVRPRHSAHGRQPAFHLAAPRRNLTLPELITP